MKNKTTFNRYTYSRSKGKVKISAYSPINVDATAEHSSQQLMKFKTATKKYTMQNTN